MVSKTLSELLRPLGASAVIGSQDKRVGHVTRDSRRVRADSIFVAVVGATVDGHRFVADLDCAAVVVDRDLPAADGVTVVRVDDTKRALALLSAGLHDHPADQVDVIGITGLSRGTTEEAMAEFLGENNVSFPVAYDSGVLGQRFGAAGVPHSAIIRDGKIAWVGHPATLTGEDAAGLRKLLARK